MSQHRFETTTAEGSPCRVVLGWDRPLQGFFMLIELLEDDGAADPLFDNLEQDVSHPDTLDTYRQVLDRMGIRVPEAMLQAAERDKDSEVDRGFVFWGRDGDGPDTWLFELSLGEDDVGEPNQFYVCCTEAEKDRLNEKVAEVHGQGFVYCERLGRMRPQDATERVLGFATALETVGG